MQKQAYNFQVYYSIHNLLTYQDSSIETSEYFGSRILNQVIT